LRERLSVWVGLGRVARRTGGQRIENNYIEQTGTKQGKKNEGIRAVGPIVSQGLAALFRGKVPLSRFAEMGTPGGDKKPSLVLDGNAVLELTNICWHSFRHGAQSSGLQHKRGATDRVLSGAG